MKTTLCDMMITIIANDELWLFSNKAKFIIIRVDKFTNPDACCNNLEGLCLIV